MAKSLRWALVPLSGVAVWYATLLLGVVGLGLLDRLCPPEQVVSGACAAWWHAPAAESLVLLCSGIVSAGLVVVPALVAPGRRFPVAVAAYACGAAFAGYAASGGGLWGPFLVAALVGTATLWIAGSRWRTDSLDA